MANDPSPDESALPAAASPPEIQGDPCAYFCAEADARALDGIAIAESPALKILGPSPFPKSGFPLLGFLESAYEHLATHAERRLPK